MVKENIGFDELSRKIYKQNVQMGWWPEGRCLFQTLQLVSTEVAEATEGDRKDLMDDHLQERKMHEVELADALIRTLDVGGKLNLNFIEQALPDDWVCETSTVGKQHLGINRKIVQFAEMIDGNIRASKTARDLGYSEIISSILYCSQINGYDVLSALSEKVEYNKHRADHKRENREKVGGKSY